MALNETFSTNREFDFVRLDGLRRATGRPAHEWDLYILKELVDNALDADERLWQQDPALFPDIAVRMEYTFIPLHNARRLIVEVQNRALFPADHIPEIFATARYTSSKTFSKTLTRGSLGNALKTLLGIPYALHERSTGRWEPELKPMAIYLEGREYRPRYLVDRTAQTIEFTCAERTGHKTAGTTVSIGLDVFDQERPRLMEDIRLLADQYHALNPHAAFRWEVDLEREAWTQSFEPDLRWQSKFGGLAPVHWYQPGVFQDLLAVLYRQQFSDDEFGALPLSDVAERFAGLAPPSPAALAAIMGAIGSAHLTKRQIEEVAGAHLYQALVKTSPTFDANALGAVGEAFVKTTLTHSLPVDGEVMYSRVVDSSEPDVPFVLELATAYLKPGVPRQVWTGINFAPTYGDPFLRAWLRPPIRPDEAVLGLRGFLEAYGLVEDSPVLVWLHLICPNVEHNEFSKTEINPLPFRRVLAQALHEALTGLQQRRDEAEMQLEQAVTAVIEAILAELGPQDRFIFDQLLARVRTELARDPVLAAWLSRPEAEGRLRSYAARHQSRSTVLAQRVVRQAAATISLPVHPDGYVLVPVEHLAREWFARYHANKILLVQSQELEPVIVENGWLCQMDMGLLHNVPGLDTALVRLLGRCDEPVALLRDATPEGEVWVESLQRALAQAQLDPRRLVDLSLDPQAAGAPAGPARLVEMWPTDLANWLARCFTGCGLPLKWMPGRHQVRYDIRQRVDQLLKETLWEGIEQRLAVSQLLLDLDHSLGVTATIRAERLDEKLRERLEQPRCREEYSSVLRQVVDEFYTAFMSGHEPAVRALVDQRVPQV